MVRLLMKIFKGNLFCTFYSLSLPCATKFVSSAYVNTADKSGLVEKAVKPYRVQSPYNTPHCNTDLDIHVMALIFYHAILQSN